MLTKRTTFGVQRSPYCIATVPLLEGKSTTFEAKQRVFARHFIAHPTLPRYQPLVYKQHNHCTRKTQEFRAKDFVVHSARSFERLEMQILSFGATLPVEMVKC